ncbi:hypothetical protein M422DRAFT_259161 [Sphaerobolus stellatus SS14]|uniref:Uncharacterized protein n=1 Tax=Sphaerobolus stellatus (strain SS14) TaxID=990650 RepID=A0A0C9V9P1_SPHS4|nr:hypothetical protein M422DRAFT_259161 [Sphaerobolus stellatus SS14]
MVSTSIRRPVSILHKDLRRLNILHKDVNNNNTLLNNSNNKLLPHPNIPFHHVTPLLRGSTPPLVPGESERQQYSPTSRRYGPSDTPSSHPVATNLQVAIAVVVVVVGGSSGSRLGGGMRLRRQEYSINDRDRDCRIYCRLLLGDQERLHRRVRARVVTIEVIGHVLQLEEVASNVNRELAVIKPVIDDAFRVGGENPRRREDDLGIGLDRVLQTLIAELSSRIDTVPLKPYLADVAMNC